MRLTDEMLLEGNTKKAGHVVEALAAKHISPPATAAAASSAPAASPTGQGRSAGAAVGKTLVYSLYNSELYVALTQMQRRGGWVSLSLRMYLVLWANQAPPGTVYGGSI